MSILKKSLFTVVVLVLTLLVFECGLRLTSIGEPREKLWIKTRTGWGTCYSEDATGYYPLSIRDSASDRKNLERELVSCHAHYALEHLKEGQLGFDGLVARAPHCIVYNEARRREGFFRDRARQIALVGDSFAFGEGIKDRDTLGYRLGLKRRDTNFLNHGRPGADVAVVQTIVATLVDKDPDLDGVIYIFNLNDIFIEGGAHPDTDIDEETAVLYGFDRQLGRHSTSDRIVASSRILTLIKKVSVQRRRTKRTIDAFLRRYQPDNPDYIKLGRHLVEMAELARKSQVPFQIVVYPLLHKDPFGDYPFAAIHRQLLDLCRKRGLSCVDAYPAFKDHRTLDGLRINAVDSHPSGAANQLVVNHLHSTDALRMISPKESGL